MKVIVKRLRNRGARISNASRQALEPVAGVITVYGLGTSIQLSLKDPNSNVADPLLPNLCDARLVNMHGDKLLFFGIERTADPDAAQYAQEWSV